MLPLYKRNANLKSAFLNFRVFVLFPDIDECASDPCINGVCQNMVAGFNCVCEDGYIGIHCQIRKLYTRQSLLVIRWLGFCP